MSAVVRFQSRLIYLGRLLNFLKSIANCIRLMDNVKYSVANGAFVENVIYGHCIQSDLEAILLYRLSMR